MGGDWRKSVTVTVFICAMIAAGCDEDTVMDVPDEQCEIASDRELHAWGLTFRAETEVIGEAPTTIQTIVTASNTLGEQVTFRKWLGGCAVIVRAYLDRDRLKLVWHEGRAHPPERDVACADYEFLTVPPGESRQFGDTLAAFQILGDSLLPGCYYFDALVEADDILLELGAGSAVLSR